MKDKFWEIFESNANSYDAAATDKQLDLLEDYVEKAGSQQGHSGVSASSQQSATETTGSDKLHYNHLSKTIIENFEELRKELFDACDELTEITKERDMLKTNLNYTRETLGAAKERAEKDLARKQHRIVALEAENISVWRSLGVAERSLNQQEAENNRNRGTRGAAKRKIVELEQKIAELEQGTKVKRSNAKCRLVNGTKARNYVGVVLFYYEAGFLTLRFRDDSSIIMSDTWQVEYLRVERGE
jgi:chromosome segregation ATPase